MNAQSIRVRDELSKINRHSTSRLSVRPKQAGVVSDSCQTSRPKTDDTTPSAPPVIHTQPIVLPEESTDDGGVIVLLFVIAALCMVATFVAVRW